LRDQLIAELKDLNSAEQAADWAHRALAAKASLVLADAKQVELEHVPSGLNREDSPGAIYEGFYRH
jgi:hypothetical protein